MTINQTRRSRLLGLFARRQTWELEDIKERNRLTTAALAAADKAEKEMQSQVEQTESLLYRAISGKLNMDLTTVQTIREYLGEQYHLHKQCTAEQQRAAQRASQVETQLKQASLTIKALETVKDNLDGEIKCQLEKRLLAQNLELWLQHLVAGK